MSWGPLDSLGLAALHPRLTKSAASLLLLRSATIFSHLKFVISLTFLSGQCTATLSNQSQIELHLS